MVGRNPIGTVELFDFLFVGTEFLGDNIIVCQVIYLRVLKHY